jgi:hypothetical protein
MPDQGRIITPDGVRKQVGHFALPRGVIMPGKRIALPKDVDALPRYMVHRRQRRCTQCSMSFTETIIAPIGEEPKERPVEDRPDLCSNCFDKLNAGITLIRPAPKRPPVPEKI